MVAGFIGCAVIVGVFEKNQDEYDDDEFEAIGPPELYGSRRGSDNETT